MNPQPDYVFDSFALLAFFLGEPGGPIVEALLEQCMRGEITIAIPSVNLGEVFYRLTRVRGPNDATEAMARVDEYGLTIVDIDRSLAVDAATIKAAYRMGYLDCFMVALAQPRSATILTGDPGFQQVANLVPVQWLPQR